MARLKQQCPTCKDWYAHGFCGNCERVLTDVVPLDVGEVIKREGWFCTSCGHRHAGPTLANICVGCSCQVTEHTTAEDDWIRIASENAKDATARLEAAQAEIEHLKAEHTRAILRYTMKGYQAGENTDSKHWRQRAEDATARQEQVQKLYEQTLDQRDSALSELTDTRRFWQAAKDAHVQTLDALQAEKIVSQEHWNYFLQERSECGRLSVALKEIADMDLQFAQAKDMHDRAIVALARPGVRYEP